MTRFTCLSHYDRQTFPVSRWIALLPERVLPPMTWLSLHTELVRNLPERLVREAGLARKELVSGGKAQWAQQYHQKVR